MKYVMLFLFLAFGLVSEAQTYSMQESMMEQNGELVPTLQITLEPKVSDFSEKFEDYLNNNRDVDLGSKRLMAFDDRIMVAKGLIIKSISNQKIDLKVFLDESALDKTQFNVFASFGFTKWITPRRYPFEYAAMNAFIIEFVKTHLSEYHKDQVEEKKKD